MHEFELRDINIAIETIDSSLQHLKTLQRLQKLALESGSEYTQTLTRIAVANIRQYCLDDRFTIGVESCGVATESIADVADKIWQGIKKAFLYVWDALTWLFRSNKTERLERELRLKAEVIKEILEHAADNPKFDEVRYIDDRSILDAFGYINEATITESVIVNRLKSLSPVADDLERLFQHYAELSKFIKMTILDHNDHPNSNARLQIEDYSKHLVDNNLATMFTPVTRLDHTVFLNEGEMVDPEEPIVVERCREINQYLHNDVVYFIACLNKPYDIFRGRNSLLRQYHNKMPYLSASGLEALRDGIETTTRDVDKLKQAAERYTKTIQTNINSAMKVVESEKYAHEQPDDAIDMARSLLSVAKKCTVTLANSFVLMERDLVIYNNILDLNIKRYKS